MKYIEQIKSAIIEYNRKHQFPASVVGMTPAMNEIVKTELGAKGDFVTIRGVCVERRDISDKPLFWIGGTVDFHTPKEPVDPEKVMKALDMCGNMLCNDNCPYFRTDDCARTMKRDAVEIIKELRGNKT